MEKEVTERRQKLAVEYLEKRGAFVHLPKRGTFGSWVKLERFRFPAILMILPETAGWVPARYITMAHHLYVSAMVDEVARRGGVPRELAVVSVVDGRWERLWSRDDQASPYATDDRNAVRTLRCNRGHETFIPLWNCPECTDLPLQLLRKGQVESAVRALEIIERGEHILKCVGCGLMNYQEPTVLVRGVPDEEPRCVDCHEAAARASVEDAARVSLEEDGPAFATLLGNLFLWASNCHEYERQCEEEGSPEKAAQNRMAKEAFLRAGRAMIQAMAGEEPNG